MLADNINEDCKKVLFFASEKDYASLKRSLMKKDIPILSIDAPDIPDNVQILTVLAISNNDLDNLLLCNKARHHFPNVYLIAKCNDALYQDVFKDTGVHQIISSNYSEDSIMTHIPHTPKTLTLVVTKTKLSLAVTREITFLNDSRPVYHSQTAKI